MNVRTIVPALLAALAALPIAIAQVPASSVRSDDAALAAPGGETKMPSRSFRRAVADVDARHCLEFPANQQVIMCAEKYRPHARRAAAT